MTTEITEPTKEQVPFTEARQAQFIHDVWGILTNYGYGEDDWEVINYIRDEVMIEALTEMIRNNWTADETGSRYRPQFDEEFEMCDTPYFSMGKEFAKLFLKYSLPSNAKPQSGKEAKISVRETWGFKCPYCNKHNNWGTRPEHHQKCEQCEGTYTIFIPKKDTSEE